MDIVHQLMRSNGRNWDKKTLAKKLNISPAYISNLFSGNKFLNLEFLAKLEKLFNVGFRIATSDMVVKQRSEIYQSLIEKSDFKIRDDSTFSIIYYGKATIASLESQLLSIKETSNQPLNAIA
jgi:transcriptional regulator with XRE-family HTH domain